MRKSLTVAFLKFKVYTYASARICIFEDYQMMAGAYNGMPMTSLHRGNGMKTRAYYSGEQVFEPEQCKLTVIFRICVWTKLTFS